MLNDLNLFKLDYDHFSSIRHNKNSSSKNRLHQKKGSKWKQIQKHLSSPKMNTLFSVIVCVVCDVCVNARKKNCWIDSIYLVRPGRLYVVVCIISEKILSFNFTCAALKWTQPKLKQMQSTWIIIMFCNWIRGQFSVCFVEILNIILFKRNSEIQMEPTENDFLNKTKSKHEF